MEPGGYKTDETNNRDDTDEIILSKYFYRQFLIVSAIWALNFSCGLGMGAPTVLIPQLRKASNYTGNDEIESWLYSSFGFVAVPWVLILPSTSTYVGRKLLYIISCISMLLAFLILYFSSSPYHILLSEVVGSLNQASNLTITVVILCEYTDPKYRGIFLAIKAASFFLGIWVANAIGSFFHWKYIGVAGILSSIYTFVGFWQPESPHWLASKGRYEQSRLAFRWLRGSSAKAESELRTIIDTQIDYRKLSLGRTKPTRRWQYLKETLRCRQFYKPFGVTVLASAQYHCSGKLVCTTYAIDVIQKMTHNEASAYTGMLILDGVTVFGMLIGSLISKNVKRRTLFLTSSFIGVLFLLLLAFYSYLVKLCVLEENTTVAILLLIVYSVSISCGPMIMAITVTGEVIPLKYQAISYTMNLTIFSISFTIILKFAPLIFKTLGMHGSFLLFGLSAGALTFALYLYLPETKDKTLLEIEEYFGESKRVSAGSPEQEAALIFTESQKT